MQSFEFDLSNPYVAFAIILLIFVSFYTIRELLSDLIKTSKIVKQNKEIIELLTIIAAKREDTIDGKAKLHDSNDNNIAGMY